MSPATPLRLDTSKCDRCGSCAAECSSRALRIGPGYILVDWDSCTGCGRCAEACETGAIVVRAATPRQHGRERDDVATPSVARSDASLPPPDAPAGAPVYAKPVREAREHAWSLREAALVVIVIFSLVVGADAIRSLGSDPASGASIAHLVSSGGLAVLAWYLARGQGSGLLRAFRLDAVPEVRDVALAIAVALGCRVFSLAYASIVPPPGVQGPGLLTGMFGGGVFGVVVTFTVVALFAPLLEEVLLRGVVRGALADRIGAWGAICASAAVFALMHLDVWSLLPFAVLGIGLGWLATRGRSLWPAVIAHVLYNVAILAATFMFYAAAR